MSKFTDKIDKIIEYVDPRLEETYSNLLTGSSFLYLSGIFWHKATSTGFFDRLYHFTEDFIFLTVGGFIATITYKGIKKLIKK